MVVPESKVYKSEDAFNSAWPLWQDGMQQRSLVAVEVEDKLDSLFESLFQTQSNFQASLPMDLCVSVGLCFAEKGARRTTVYAVGGNKLDGEDR